MREIIVRKSARILLQVVWTRQGLQMKGNEKHQMTYDEASGKVRATK